MTRDSYDVVVVGFGAMGSATAWALARRGARVLVLDQFPPGHTRGSSHGESRIIRQLYFEHPLYVPILRRAYALWGELESDVGVPLLCLGGGLTLGPRTGRIVPGAREAAKRYGLGYEELDADGVASRFPAIRPPDDYVGLWDPRGGYIRADAAMQAFHTVGSRLGVELRTEEVMTHWLPDGDGVTVETTAGRYRADQLVLCVGPWAPRLLGELNLPLAVERQVLVWFDPPQSPDLFDVAHFPIFVYEYQAGDTAYGFPRLSTGVKAAVFHGGPAVPDPDTVQSPVTDDEIEAVREALSAAFPSIASAPVRSTTTCLFTNTPDSRFVIGWHPAHRQVLVCSPCSGHGFKFAPAIGDINAELLTTGTSTVDLSPFEVTRFMSGP
jgi:sarcosine oxidase